jgi:hypothetical protein
MIEKRQLKKAVAIERRFDATGRIEVRGEQSVDFMR